MGASMISKVDSAVEFEVSLGNYGNKLDESLPPSACTSQPTNAVFDGSYYYFLPWAERKPCVVIDSHWEDISFRLEALNLLIGITDRLVGGQKFIGLWMWAAIEFCLVLLFSVLWI